MTKTLEKPRPDTSPKAVAERRALVKQMSVHNDLEGLSPLSPEAAAIQERMILGELTPDEAVAEYKRLNGI
jgi:hypothetical protein